MSSAAALALEAEEEAFCADPHYLRMEDDVLGVLHTFVKCRDWPDFIHSLEKMKRVFRMYPQLALVPEKVTVAKRLAQGCTCATDSVHAKTLELYELIFERIGPMSLARDLSLYSLGIFSLFAHANAAVTLKALRLLQRFYVTPLRQQLTPALPGLLSALLPLHARAQRAPPAQSHSPPSLTRTAAVAEASLGLGETVRELLAQLADAIGAPTFYSALWRTLLSAPDARLGGLLLLHNMHGEPRGRRPAAPSATASPRALSLGFFGFTAERVEEAAAAAAPQPEEETEWAGYAGGGPSCSLALRALQCCLCARGQPIVRRAAAMLVAQSFALHECPSRLQPALGEAATPCLGTAAARTSALAEAMLTLLADVAQARARESLQRWGGGVMSQVGLVPCIREIHRAPMHNDR